MRGKIIEVLACGAFNLLEETENLHKEIDCNFTQIAGKYNRALEKLGEKEKEIKINKEKRQ